MSGSITVLGSSAAWPEPGRACNGFLIEYGQFRLVLDLGYGTLSRLLEHLGSVVADRLDAVVVTHRHGDHAGDLPALLRARWFGWRQAPPLPLFSPPDVVDQLAAAGDVEAVHHVFEWHEIPAAQSHVGPFTLDSRALPHYVPNAGVRLSAEDVTIAYTGDTGPAPNAAELGRGADIFIVEATDRHQQGNQPESSSGERLNLTAQEAGATAHKASAQQLMLTHFWPGNDRQASLADACSVFSGPIVLADEGQSFPIKGSSSS